MKNKKVLVTGGAGFIGSHLVDSLVENNEVKVIDNLSAGKRKNINEKAKFTKIDITNFKKLTDSIEDPDVIFHLAADAHTKETSMGWDDPLADCEVNSKGTANIFEIVRKKDLDSKIVYASSAAIYGKPGELPISEGAQKNPLSPYGVHKLSGEKYMSAYCSEFDLDISSARIFNTFGPKQPRYVMYDFFKKLMEDNSELTVLGTGKQTRDYCYVSDTVRALELIAKKGKSSEGYNISGENVITISELAMLMIDICNLDTEIKYTKESWKGDLDRLEADISKIKELGFQPQIGLEEGLKRFKDYFESTEGKIKK